MARLRPCLIVGFMISFSATALTQRRDHVTEETVEVQRAVANFIGAFNNLEWERFRQSFADDTGVLAIRFDGYFVGRFGRYGNYDGQFLVAHGVAVGKKLRGVRG